MVKIFPISIAPPSPELMNITSSIVRGSLNAGACARSTGATRAQKSAASTAAALTWIFQP
jgi:hypothetical protein